MMLSSISWCSLSILNMPFTHLASIKYLCSIAVKSFVLICILNLSRSYWFIYSLYNHAHFCLEKNLQTYCLNLHFNPFRFGICTYQWTGTAFNTFILAFLPQSSIECDSINHECLWNQSSINFLQNLLFMNFFFILLSISKQNVKYPLHIWSSNNSSHNPSKLQTQCITSFWIPPLK